MSTQPLAVPIMVELLDMLRQVSAKQLEMVQLVAANVAQWAEVDSESPDEIITPALKAFFVDLQKAVSSGKTLSKAIDRLMVRASEGEPI